MKLFTTLLIAAALVAPQAALAQRHTTPGQADRHASAQAEARGETAVETPRAERETGLRDQNRTAHRVTAAKAGKVITSRPVRGGR